MSLTMEEASGDLAKQQIDHSWPQREGDEGSSQRCLHWVPWMRASVDISLEKTHRACLRGCLSEERPWTETQKIRPSAHLVLLTL